MLPWQPVVRTTHSHCKGPEFNPTCHMTWQKRKKMAEMVNLLLCMVVVGGLVAQSCPSLEIPWTIAHQAPLSMGFSRWEYWSDLPFPSPGDLPDPGIKPTSLALQVDSLPILPPGNFPGEDYSAVKGMNSSYSQNGWFSRWLCCMKENRPKTEYRYFMFPIVQNSRKGKQIHSE